MEPSVIRSPVITSVTQINTKHTERKSWTRLRSIRDHRNDVTVINQICAVVNIVPHDKKHIFVGIFPVFSLIIHTNIVGN